MLLTVALIRPSRRLPIRNREASSAWWRSDPSNGRSIMRPEDGMIGRVLAAFTRVTPSESIGSTSRRHGRPAQGSMTISKGSGHASVPRPPILVFGNAFVSVHPDVIDSVANAFDPFECQ